MSVAYKLFKPNYTFPHIGLRYIGFVTTHIVSGYRSSTSAPSTVVLDLIYVFSRAARPACVFESSGLFVVCSC